MDTTSFQPDDLLTHVGFVRALARSLLADQQLAQDLAQETWLTALRKRPRTDRGLRPWLAAVTRRLARHTMRGELRRSEREQLVAGKKGEPSAAEAIERLDTAQQLVAEVKALDVSSRDVILLRFFHELSVHAATRAATPAVAYTNNPRATSNAVAQEVAPGSA